MIMFGGMRGNSPEPVSGATFYSDLWELSFDELPAVSDLTAEECYEMSHYVWTQPVCPWNRGARMTWDLRWSHSPINTSNWDSLSTCTGCGVGFGIIPGVNFIGTYADFPREDTLGVYLALKYSIGEDEWSPMSNVVYCDPFSPGGGPEDGIVARRNPDDAVFMQPSGFVNLAGGREARFQLTVHPGDTGRSVRVDAFDVTGRLVRKIYRSSAVQGTTTVSWDYRTDTGAEVRPGVYFIRCTVGSRAFKTTRIVNAMN